MYMELSMAGQRLDLMIYDEEVESVTDGGDIAFCAPYSGFLIIYHQVFSRWPAIESGLYLSDQNGDNIKHTKEGKYRITLDLNKMEFTMTEITE